MLMAEMGDKGLPRKHGFAVTSQVVMLTFFGRCGGSLRAGAPLARGGMGTALSLMSPGSQTDPQKNSYSFDWYSVSVWGDFGGAGQQEVGGPQGSPVLGRATVEVGTEAQRALQLPKTI